MLAEPTLLSSVLEESHDDGNTDDDETDEWEDAVEEQTQSSSDSSRRFLSPLDEMILHENNSSSNSIDPFEDETRKFLTLDEMLLATSTTSTSDETMSSSSSSGADNDSQDNTQCRYNTGDNSCNNYYNTEYSKYFLMLRAGVPKQWVVKACEVDGRDPMAIEIMAMRDTEIQLKPKAPPQALTIDDHEEEIDFHNEEPVIVGDEIMTTRTKVVRTTELDESSLSQHDSSPLDEAIKNRNDTDYNIAPPLDEASRHNDADYNMVCNDDAWRMIRRNDSQDAPSDEEGEEEDGAVCRQTVMDTNEGNEGEEENGSLHRLKVTDDTKKAKDNDNKSDVGDGRGGLMSFFLGRRNDELKGINRRDDDDSRKQITFEAAPDDERTKSSSGRKGDVVLPAAAISRDATVVSVDEPVTLSSDDNIIDQQLCDLPPRYHKYVLMLKAGTPRFRVRLLAELDGNDPAVLFGRSDGADVDNANKKGNGKHNNEANNKGDTQSKTMAVASDAPIIQEVPLSKDVRFSRYFLMLKARVPRDRVRQVLEMDGKDPTILDLDPNRSHDSQVVQKVVKENEQQQARPWESCLQLKRQHDEGGYDRPRPRDGEYNSNNNHNLGDSFTANAIDEYGGAQYDAGNAQHERNASSTKAIVVGQHATRDLTTDHANLASRGVCEPHADVAALFAARGQGANNDIGEGSSTHANHVAVRQGGDNVAAIDADLDSGNVEENPTGVTSVANFVGNAKKSGNVAALFADRASKTKLGALFATRAATLAPNVPSGGKENVLNGTKEPNSVLLLKDEPELQKYFNMLKLGLPLGATKQAMEKDGKDSSILDLDPNKPRPVESKGGDDNKPALKDDPEFQKYFKMLKLGLPLGAAKQAMIKDGKDSSILDLDHNKPLALQAKGSGDIISNKALKDDPEFQKYFKMIKLGLPLGAVKQAMEKDGKDSSVLDLDPNKSLACQRLTAKSQKGKNSIKPNEPKVVRKRLFWNSIDKSNLQGSLWAQAGESQHSLDLKGLEYDEEEFANLFTLVKDKGNTKADTGAPKGKLSTTSSKKPQKKEIQLIDSRRQMNGSILLTKYKHDYRVLAQKVNEMDSGGMCETELLALLQLLPSKDEALKIRSYLPVAKGCDNDDAISKLGECEKYMASMLEVDNATGKLRSMIYRVQFKSLIDSLVSDVTSLQEAVDCVRNSDRLTRLMLFALRLGNTLNTGGPGKEVTAITLDSLLKLQEAKAFDKKTSVLHYLVKIIEKNDKDILNVSTDLVPALKAERITMESLTKSLSDLQGGLSFTKSMTSSGDGRGPMHAFVLEADVKLKDLSTEFQKCKQSSLQLLRYFGEDQNKPLNEFFGTLARFVAMFESARAECRRLEDAKARKERRIKTKVNATKKSRATVEVEDPTNFAASRSSVLHEILERGPKKA